MYPVSIKYLGLTTAKSIIAYPMAASLDERKAHELIDYDFLLENFRKGAKRIKSLSSPKNHKKVIVNVAKLGGIVAGAYVANAMSLPINNIPPGNLLVQMLFEMAKETHALFPNIIDVGTHFLNGAQGVVTETLNNLISNASTEIAGQWAAIRNSTLVPIKDNLIKYGIETVNFVKDVSEGILPQDRKGWVDLTRNSAIFLFLYKAEKILDKIGLNSFKKKKIETPQPQAVPDETVKTDAETVKRVVTRTVITLSEERVELPDDQDTLGM